MAKEDMTASFPAPDDAEAWDAISKRHSMQILNPTRQHFSIVEVLVTHAAKPITVPACLSAAQYLTIVDSVAD